MTKIATKSGSALTEVVLGILAGGVQFALLEMAKSFTGQGAQLTLAFALFVSLPTLAFLAVGTTIYAYKDHLTSAGFLRLWAPTLLALGLAITIYGNEVSRKDDILNQWENEREAAKYKNDPGPIEVNGRYLASNKWVGLQGYPIWSNEDGPPEDGYPRLKYDGYKLQPGQYLAIEFLEQKDTPQGRVTVKTPGPRVLIPVPDYEHVDAAIKASKESPKRAIVPRQVGLTLYAYPDHIETAVFLGLTEVTLFHPQMGDPQTTVGISNHSGDPISQISVNGWGATRNELAFHCGGAIVRLPYALRAPLKIDWQTANDQQWHRTTIDSLPSLPSIPRGATKVSPYDMKLVINPGEKIEFGVYVQYTVPPTFSLPWHSQEGERQTATTTSMGRTQIDHWIPACPETVSR